MNHSQLTKEELIQFTNIHEQIIPKRRKNFEIYEIWDPASRNADKNKNVYPLIDPIIKKGINILEQNGINNFNSKRYTIEFHQRNCGFEKKKHTWSRWHRDDDANRHNFKVYSILFYLRKDKTVNGGDLEYQIQGIKLKHIVNGGDVLDFKGDMLHKPESTSGFGCRDIIVLFINRN